MIRGRREPGPQGYVTLDRFFIEIEEQGRLCLSPQQLERLERVIHRLKNGELVVEER
jgi:hypothetical protein